MKKLTLLVAVMLLGISTVSLSQIKYGIKAGLTSANQDWSAGGISINPDARMGLAMGVFVNFMISDKIGIQPELLYVMKGAKVDGAFFDEEATEDVTLKADYLSIPIMVKYYFGGLNLQAGPTFDLLMSAKSVYDDEDEDIKDQLKGMDMGLAFGLGYDLPMKLGFDLRYIIGLSDINDSEDMTGVEMKNKCLMFTVAYTF